MTTPDLKKSVLDYAINRSNGPFTTAEAFENIKDAQDTTEISQVLRLLFMDGYLRRKKIDKIRYAYCISDHAPNDFVSADRKLKGNKEEDAMDDPLEAITEDTTHPATEPADKGKYLPTSAKNIRIIQDNDNITIATESITIKVNRGNPNNHEITISL